MTPVLLVELDCPSCCEARQVWEQACAQLELQLQLRYSGASGTSPKTVPLLVIDGVPVFAGVPEPDQALQLLAGCRRRVAPPAS